MCSDIELHRHAAERLAEELAARGAEGCKLAIVLGSGLSAVVERLEKSSSIPGADLEYLPKPSVHGHAGAFATGELGGLRVLVQNGRVHLYENRGPFEVTRAVRAFARLGVRALVLTNAAGALVSGWRPGTLVRLADHINLQGRSPLWPGEGSRRSPYDVELGDALTRCARELELPLESGVYGAMLGPTYETPAEIRALQRLGVHAVGMSTASEASAAHAAGMRVVGISCIANLAAGLGRETLTHEDVLAVMARAADGLGRLLERATRAWRPILGS